MEKKLSRIVGFSELMTNYPDSLLSTFDRRAKSQLSWILINNSPVGFDRKELDQKIKPSPSSLKNNHQK